MRRLVDWVKGSGGKVHAAVCMQAGRQGFGLAAGVPVRAGEVLVQLPVELQLMQHSDDARQLTDLIDRVPAELWQAKMALCLLRQRSKGAQSAFAPYIDLLPAVHHGVPMFWNGDTLQLLQYPPLVEQVKKRSRFLIDLSKDIDNAVFSNQRIDANALGWALTSVSSRAFRVGRVGGGHVVGARAEEGGKEGGGSGENRWALLPLIDMANHSFSSNAEVLCEMDGSVSLLARRDLAPQEPVLVNYGNLSNELLLLDYGFLMDPNPHDRCALSFDMALVTLARQLVKALPEHHELADTAPWRQKILESLRLVGAEANLQVQIGGEEAIEGRLLAALRVLLAPAAEQEALEGTSVQELSSWNCRVDPILDANVTRTAIALCAIALRCAGKVGLFYTYIWSLLPQIRGLFDSFAPQLLPHKVGGGSG